MHFLREVGLSTLVLLVLFVSVAFGQKEENSIRKQLEFKQAEVSQKSVIAENPSADVVTGTTYPATVASGVALESMTGSTQLLGASQDDATSSVFNTGFEFWFDGIRYTQFSASSNGLVSFGATTNSGAANDLATANPKAAAYWDDLCTGTTGQVHARVIGSAPNRKLVVEFQNMVFYSSSSTACSTTSFGTYQVWVYEARNSTNAGQIVFVYGAGTPVNTGGNSGYSVGISSSATSFASITTATPSVSYATSNNTQTNAIAAGTGYVFTPNVPASPTGLTFGASTATTNTLNWTDNSSNEFGFVIYRSTDNVTFNYLTQTAANTTTYTDTGLSPSTTYYYQVYAVSEGALSTAAATGSQSTAAPGSIISTPVGGNWSATTTWVGGVVPTASDNVTIADTATVTIDVTTATCLNLNVGTGTGGTLQYISTPLSTLTVNGGVTVAAGATFSAGTGTLTTHTLLIGGNSNTIGNTSNLTVNGTFDMNTTAGVTTTFFGSGNGTVSGTGTTADFYAVVVNKGTTATGAIQDITRVITMNAPTSSGTRLILTNGTFKMSSASTITPYFAGQTISAATARLWINNASAVITSVGVGTTTGAGAPTVSGILQVDAGTFGYGSGNNTMAMNGSLIIGGSSAAVNNFGPVTFGSAAIYTQTAGNFNVDVQAGNTVSSTAQSSVSIASGTVVNFTGGTLTIIDPHPTNTSTTNADFLVSGTTGAKNFVGSIIRFGDGTSSSAGNATTLGFQISIPSAVLLGTVAINNPTGTNRQVRINAAVSTTLNVSNFNLFAGTFNINGGTLLTTGNISNSGVINGSTAGSVLYFFGSTTPSLYSGAGTITTPLQTLSIDNPAGVTIDSASPGFTVLRVNLFDGTITNSNKITLGNGGTTSAITQIGVTGNTLPGGNYDASPTFNAGTGGVQVVYAQETVARTTSFEIPGTRILQALTINNTNGVTLAGGNLSIAGTLTLTAGLFTTSSANLPTITATTTGSISGGSTTSYVRGPLARTLPASLVTGSTYTFPIGKSGYNLYELVNPTTTAAGTVVVQAEVFDADSGGTAGTGLTSISNNRYWQATASGAGNLTNTQVRLTEIPLSGNRIGQSATVNGVYNSIGGTVSGNTVLSSTTTSLGFFVIGQFTFAGGTYTVGTGGNYGTLTAAITALNSAIITGPIVLSLTDTTYSAGETFPLTINANGGASSTNTITIKPAAGVTSSIIGANATAIFDLSGAKFVIIDGSNAVNGTTQDLTIRNTNTSGATIRFINDAVNNTVKNTIVEGVSTSTTNGVVFFSTGTTTGNDSNTITANTIRDRSDAAGVPANLIYSAGSSSTITNTNNVISNNTLNNFTANGITSTSTGNESWTISGNTILESAARTTALIGMSFAALGTNTITQNIIRDLNTSGAVTGITLGDARSTTVSRNRIYSIPSTSGSTSTLIGIVSTGSSGTAASVNIVNNMISIVPSFTNAQTIQGLRDFGFSGNTWNAYFNSVLVGGTGSLTSNTYACQRGSSAPTVSGWRDNICFNGRTGGTGNHFAMGDSSDGTGTLTLDYNLYVGTGATAANFFDRSTSSTVTPVSFTAWKGGTRDLNSQASNPTGNYTIANMFASNADLHLKTSGTNPALSTGNATGTSITTDFDNDPRPASTPDIGADEVIQAVGGVIAAGTYYNLLATNGDALGGDVTITNLITLNGIMTTGANKLTINCGAGVSGAGETAYVDGNVQKNFCDNTPFSFPVGENGYSPVTVTPTNSPVAGTALTVDSVDAMLSGLNPLNSPTRSWTLTETGDLAAILAFTYNENDVVGNESVYKIYRYNGAVNVFIPGTNNTGANTVTTAAAQTDFSPWGMGDSPTAAEVTVSGRVTQRNGRGIFRAKITVVDSEGVTRTAYTNPFGYYRFEEIAAGGNYIFTVSHLRYQFAEPTQAQFIGAETDGVNFTALDIGSVAREPMPDVKINVQPIEPAKKP